MQSLTHPIFFVSHENLQRWHPSNVLRSSFSFDEKMTRFVLDVGQSSLEQLLVGARRRSL